jgi:hypothetical protein
MLGNRTNCFSQGWSDVDTDKLENQEARLEYIAFLANRGLANSDYLSQLAVCDILQAAARHIGKLHS